MNNDFDNSNGFDWGTESSGQEDLNETSELGSQENSTEGTEEEVAPVRLSKKTTMYISITLIVFIIIVLICCRGCSITKKVENSSKPSDTVNTVQETTTPITTNGGENSEKNVENSAISSEVDSSLADEIKPTEKVEEPKDTTSTEKAPVSNKGDDSSSLKEVGEPNLTEVVTTSGLVSSKNVYQLDGAYVYGVKIITLQGEEGLTCKYFCPKKTWDALNVGDTVNISYQMDSVGNTSVVSISK